jgi:hypothetical protein
MAAGGFLKLFIIELPTFSDDQKLGGAFIGAVLKLLNNISRATK